MFERKSLTHIERAAEQSSHKSTPFQQQMISYEEYYKWFNILQPNGRINRGVDSSGHQLSISIPQYLDGFIQNIELGIRPLVTALHNKNYLTTSCCAGHSIIGKVFVTLCFNDLSAIYPFKEAVENIFGVSAVISETYCNTEYRIINGEMVLWTTETIDFKKELEYLNHFFRRNSDKWMWLELTLFEDRRTNSINYWPDYGNSFS